jgi:uncharacterized protein (TIGR04540 family)
LFKEGKTLEFKTMDQVAEKIKQEVDDYWKLEISEEKLISEISSIFSDTLNRGLVMRGPNFKAGFERKLGKKRIEEIKKILIKINKELYKGLAE